MNQFLEFFILIPFIGYIITLIFIPRNKEINLFRTSVITVGINLLLFLVLSFFWAKSGFLDLYSKGITIYKADDYEFAINLFFDNISATYYLISSLLTFLILVFSRYYIHREKRFKSFFCNVLFFYLGLSFIIFSGNFETMFIGWEIIGMSSFFLIGFYRDRYLPVKNALKVVSVYRIADIFLLFGIWICHHYFKHNINFLELKTLLNQNIPIITDNNYKLIIPSIFLVVALVKSAQFPFSSWLPRAMEGPTTSSAIFYGSLSIHIGVFLMLRTYPLWADNVTFKIILIILGLITSLISTSIASVQSSVKTQIAYSSITQIGIMFIEIALGLHLLALIHFASNAFLRTYQLLVSPSMFSYLIHDQFFNFIQPKHNVSNTLFGKIKTTIYILSIKEWNMDSFMYHYLWKPLKSIGNNIKFINAKTVKYVFTPLYLIGIYFAYHKQSLPSYIIGYFPLLIGLISLLMILKAFTKREEAHKAWFLTIVSQLYTSLAISFNEQFDYKQIILYLSGIIMSAIIGYICLSVLKKYNEKTTLDRFHGHSYEHPRLSILFLIACLGLAGFPITPTFIGEDVILGHIHENQFFLGGIISIILILDGLSVFRIYSRLFLGPHEKEYHEIAYRSS